jgi:hypothetical protein
MITDVIAHYGQWSGKPVSAIVKDPEGRKWMQEQRHWLGDCPLKQAINHQLKLFETRNNPVQAT